MNLTLSTHPRKSKSNKNHQPLPPDQNRQHTQLSIFNNCPNFVFGNCMGQTHHIDTQPNEIHQNSDKQHTTSKKDSRGMRTTKLGDQQSNRKYKICLSLRQTQQKYETPKKRNNRHHLEGKSYSENKQNRAVQKWNQRKQTDNNTPKKGIKLKIKTEPVDEAKDLNCNIHHLKESMKPSTNINTPGSNTNQQHYFPSYNKHPHPSSSKKFQLTISNNFKSSLIHQPNQSEQKIVSNMPTNKKLQSNYLSQQVFIEQSFMTAKLHNIYGEIHNSFLQHPSSNIVYYNQVMANEAWKRPELIRDDNCPILASQAPEGQNLIKKKVVFKNTSILHNVDNEQEADKPKPALQSQKVDIRQKFMERKYIGEYAKTIKTFNESELRSEHESVVLQHGYQGNFQALILNRGSIKDCPREAESETIRRQCNSFGEEHNSHQIVRDRYRDYVSYPIEESSYDSERDEQ